MHLVFDNFGPLESGTLELRPLTIMIGPNQAGKSFAAMAVHAMLRGSAALGRHRWQYFRDPFDGGSYFSERVRSIPGEAALKKIAARASALSANKLLELSTNDLDALEAVTSIGQLKAAICSSFEDVFATPTQQLLRHKSKKGFVRLQDGSTHMSLDLATNTVSTSFDLRAVIPVSIAYVDRRRKDSPQSEGAKIISFRPSQQEHHHDWYLFISEVTAALRKYYDLPRPERVMPFYLPAIRSGLLLSHRLFLSLLLKNVQRAGLEPFAIPQMTGVTADFLQALLRLQDSESQPGRQAELINRFESEITGGQVYSTREAADSLPTYRFKTPSGLDIPLNLASSTVTEVAPIFLLLRKFVRPNGWVIIEEPESHLSPENQSIMAQFLVALVNHDVRVIITTHSTFLIEQINNQVSAFTASGGKAGVGIDPQKIAAHRVSGSVADSGSTLDRLEIDAIDGIDVSSFVAAYEKLYDEGFRLREKAEKMARE